MKIRSQYLNTLFLLLSFSRPSDNRPESDHLHVADSDVGQGRAAAAVCAAHIFLCNFHSNKFVYRAFRIKSYVSHKAYAVLSNYLVCLAG